MESNDIDPFCKLISSMADSPNNQTHRICMAVCTSSYYAHRCALHAFLPCHEQKVSFRTLDGIRESDGKLYRERMTSCYCILPDALHGIIQLYISRAYSSNRVFIYARNSSDGRIHLENLSTNLSILDELNSFDFVED